MDSLQNKICIHAGTQGGSILGFHGSLNVMKNLYAYSPNLGSVKCVSTNGRYLITGGFDEIIRLYDLKQKREKGQLIGHEGTITCIESFQNFVISGAEDHEIIIWKVKEWSLLYRLKGHKDSVYDLALHSSGKLLASVGKDKKILLWNMINGTKAFRKTMDFNTYKVRWSPVNENLLILSDTSVYLVSQETNKPIKDLKHPKRINDFALVNNILAVAGDDGNLYLWNNPFHEDQESFYFAFKAHTPRVKRVKHLVINEKNYLITCSTDGAICFWAIDEFLTSIESIQENKLLEEELKPIYSLNSYQRLITLDVHLESQIYASSQHATAETVEEEDGEGPELEEEDQEQKGSKKKVKADKFGKKIKKVHFEEPTGKNKQKGKKNAKSATNGGNKQHPKTNKDSKNFGQKQATINKQKKNMQRKQMANKKGNQKE